MKIPEYFKKESTHRTNSLNTLSLIGISLMWGHMLSLISLWFLPLTIFTLLGAYGSEINKRDA